MHPTCHLPLLLMLAPIYPMLAPTYPMLACIRSSVRAARSVAASRSCTSLLRRLYWSSTHDMDWYNRLGSGCGVPGRARGGDAGQREHGWGGEGRGVAREGQEHG